MEVTRRTNVKVYENYRKKFDEFFEQGDHEEVALFTLALHDCLKEKQMCLYQPKNNEIQFLPGITIRSNSDSNESIPFGGSNNSASGAKKSTSNLQLHAQNQEPLLQKETQRIYAKLSSVSDIWDSQNDCIVQLVNTALRKFDENESSLTRAVNSLMSMTASESLRGFSIVTSNLQNFLFYLSYCELWSSSTKTDTPTSRDRAIRERIRTNALDKSLELSVDGIQKRLLGGMRLWLICKLVGIGLLCSPNVISNNTLARLPVVQFNLLAKQISENIDEIKNRYTPLSESTTAILGKYATIQQTFNSNYDPKELALPLWLEQEKKYEMDLLKQSIDAELKTLPPESRRRKRKDLLDTHNKTTQIFNLKLMPTPLELETNMDMIRKITQPLTIPVETPDTEEIAEVGSKRRPENPDDNMSQDSDIGHIRQRQRQRQRTRTPTPSTSPVANNRHSKHRRTK